ncbi:MAG: VacJ family lipoprotein [Proteobacteria bacterium]|nr:VacJ family lipoprotein [Pseudomonadota bacterium]
MFIGMAVGTRSSKADVAAPHSSIYAGAKELSDAPKFSSSPKMIRNTIEPYDPLEPFNRVVFEFNRVLEGLLFNPLVHIYRGVVPPFLQKRIHCVLNNLATPVYFLNDVLQFKFERACESLTRFIINTTFGILGIFDVASELDIHPHTEDLGQTFATWGVDPGPYLVLPILGPTDLRGLIGMVGDFFADPFNYYAIHHDHRTLMDIRFAATYADERSQVLTMVENLEATSVDYYAALRSLYWQHKRARVLHDKEFNDNDEINSALDFDHPQPEED